MTSVSGVNRRPEDHPENPVPSAYRCRAFLSFAWTVPIKAFYNDPMKTRILTFCCVAAILLAQVPQAQAMEDGSAEAIAADILVVRPACLAMTVIGSALFLVSLPVAAISKSTRQSARALVVRPARATFTRPLGNMTDLEP